MHICEKSYKILGVTVYSPGLFLLQYGNVMADNSTATPGSHKARSESATIALLIDMADTTWRMFVPTVSLLLVGRYFDVRLSTKPWLMLAGAALGAVIAALLVKQQLLKGAKD